jgi:hypothetical protein
MNEQATHWVFDAGKKEERQEHILWSGIVNRVSHFSFGFSSPSCRKFLSA